MSAIFNSETKVSAIAALRNITSNYVHYLDIDPLDNKKLLAS